MMNTLSWFLDGTPGDVPRHSSCSFSVFWLPALGRVKVVSKENRVPLKFYFVFTRNTFCFLCTLGLCKKVQSSFIKTHNIHLTNHQKSSLLLFPYWTYCSRKLFHFKGLYRFMIPNQIFKIIVYIWRIQEIVIGIGASSQTRKRIFSYDKWSLNYFFAYFDLLLPSMYTILLLNGSKRLTHWSKAKVIWGSSCVFSESGKL